LLLPSNNKLAGRSTGGIATTTTEERMREGNAPRSGRARRAAAAPAGERGSRVVQGWRARSLPRVAARIHAVPARALLGFGREEAGSEGGGGGGRRERERRERALAFFFAR
jgi:hypothetical protein